MVVVIPLIEDVISNPITSGAVFERNRTSTTRKKDTSHHMQNCVNQKVLQELSVLPLAGSRCIRTLPRFKASDICCAESQTGQIFPFLIKGWAPNRQVVLPTTTPESVQQRLAFYGADVRYPSILQQDASMCVGC